MFEVIFTHDVDVTPQELKGLEKIGRQAEDGGGIEIGVIPCARITVGFIWPCGTLKVGGCTTVGSKEVATIARLVGECEKVSIKLDPEKDKEKIEKLVMLQSGKYESKE
jgi:hypothetical protein